MALRNSLHKIRPGYILKPRGKNLKFVYYLRCALRKLTPRWWLAHHKAALLASLETRPDKAEILDRVAYYNKLTSHTPISGRQTIADISKKHSVYELDTMEFARYFDSSLKIDTLFGDNTSIAQTPSIAKSRPIAGDNTFDILLNLDKVRHFTFLNDKRRFTSKENKAIFRGAVYQAHRLRFMETFFGTPLVDCADTASNSQHPPEWKQPLITLYDHLKYKFVVCLEGNDVASNLKWVMSSNSVAIMPRPKYETWFMEGRLIPNVHYIEIKDDYSDLEEKIRYYSEHAAEAEAIVRNAHTFIEQFRDPAREELISILVLKKYFELTQN